MSRINVPIQYKITTTSTNFDIFSETNIANALLTRFNLTSASISESKFQMKVTILPDTACTVIIDNITYDKYSNSNKS